MSLLGQDTMTFGLWLVEEQGPMGYAKATGSKRSAKNMFAVV